MSQLVDKAKNFVAEKVANIKKPEATVADVDLKHVTRKCIEYGSKVSVSNPYSNLFLFVRSLTLSKVLAVIASGTRTDPGSLKASYTTMLNVPVKVPYNILISLARDIGADWDIDYELQLGLTVDLPLIGDITFPLS